MSYQNCLILNLGVVSLFPFPPELFSSPVFVLFINSMYSFDRHLIKQLLFKLQFVEYLTRLRLGSALN